ncbi:MAG: S23 ribosomal protein [Parcubacteria group bacterium Gr01-1014_44]|nr:MAG: S23 ribosomal protein [Parcubacteria group bacterium Gr01-1014_44]
MGNIKSFKELKVWQKAHQLAIKIYQITKDFPSEEKFGLTSQIRRAAVSVASNIVEGFRRYSNKASKNFYDISDGSLEELKYQLLLSVELGYIEQNIYNESLNLAEEISKMLHAWSKTQM